MAKICIDARMMYASGIGTYLQNLLPALASQFNVMLIGNAEEISIKNGEIIPAEIPVYSIAEQLRLPQLIPKCDIFWSPHYNVPLLPVKAKKRLVTIHDVFHLAYFHTLSLQQKIYAKTVFNAAARLSDQVITVSAFSKSEIIRYLHVKPAKITVIPNGINHQLFKVADHPQSHQSIREKYKLPSKFILYVGNVKPHKNLISLVKAFAQIAKEVPDLFLVIVGKKEGFITGESMVFDFINQKENLTHKIIFTGYVAAEDLPLIYNLADLFVFPSKYEGFGLPPLEAMACGCPVLVSDAASMPEVCGPDMHYMNPDNMDDLALKIKEMLSLQHDARKALITIGLKKAATYTWESSIQKHIELFQNFGNVH